MFLVSIVFSLWISREISIKNFPAQNWGFEIMTLNPPKMFPPGGKLQHVPFPERLHPPADIRLREDRQIIHRVRLGPGHGIENRLNAMLDILRIVAALKHKHNFPAANFIGEIDKLFRNGKKT